MILSKVSYLFVIFFFIFLGCGEKNKGKDVVVREASNGNNSRPVVLAIHGGAGTIRRENMTPNSEKAYRAKLMEALETGYQVLDAGGTAVDAVIASVKVMEDSPFFNAGKGAVFTHDGRNEMDAAIMEGKTRNAGAVAGIP